MTLHVFGIRHHGPGCARALSAALQTLAPDALLVEGPPDANGSLALVNDPGMQPPVALLVHAVADPQRASFYPFAEFSPEWQALRYAATSGIPARFIDLPCANRLAARDDDDDDDVLHDDPLGLLAEAAGYADHEQWWDVQVEQRSDARGLFEGILEAMQAVREQHEERRTRELQREAHMRQMIRAAQREGFQRIAVVCGAWHAPELAQLGPAKPDAELLKGLTKIKVASTWVPWSYAKLSFRSGYGAGVDSPGWYAHVWRHGEKAPLVWATLAARLLREQDLDASAANVIDAVRLAGALASLRELPAPGLSELREAIDAVLIGGQRARLALIRRKLEIGDALGEVPEHAGKVPLMRDFEQQLKRLRLALKSESVTLELDLRKPIDRERSELVHRLRVLGVDWGEPLETGAGTGTFRETLQLAWTPEFAVELVAANIHGSSVELAAANVLGERGRRADLARLTELIELGLLARLPQAIELLVRELDARAASSSDVRVQMEALGPLARVVRYGDVRETKAEHVRPVLKTLFERVVVGSVPACTQLDDDAASAMVAAIGTAHSACFLLDEPELKHDWLDALSALANAEAVHPRIRGRACRLLLEQRVLEPAALLAHASLALSASVEPARAAQWIEGLVEGEGLLLLHQTELLQALDTWLRGLGDELFRAQLPLLRRAFSGLSPAERRGFAQQVKTAGAGGPQLSAAQGLDAARAARVLPVLAQILGVEHG